MPLLHVLVFFSVWLRPMLVYETCILAVSFLLAYKAAACFLFIMPIISCPTSSTDLLDLQF